MDPRRRLPAWLALFAVLMQLVASIGHVHPEDYLFLLRGHGTPVLSAGHAPSGGSSPSLAPDTDCAICASVQILGTAALPNPFALPPLREQGAAIVLATVDELWLTPPPYLLFITRGPPLI